MFMGLLGLGCTQGEKKGRGTDEFWLTNFWRNVGRKGMASWASGLGVQWL